MIPLDTSLAGMEKHQLSPRKVSLPCRLLLGGTGALPKPQQRAHLPPHLPSQPAGEHRLAKPVQRWRQRGISMLVVSGPPRSHAGGDATSAAEDGGLPRLWGRSCDGATDASRRRRGRRLRRDAGALAGPIEAARVASFPTRRQLRRLCGWPPGAWLDAARLVVWLVTRSVADCCSTLADFHYGGGEVDHNGMTTTR